MQFTSIFHLSRKEYIRSQEEIAPVPLDVTRLLLALRDSKYTKIKPSASRMSPWQLRNAVV